MQFSLDIKCPLCLEMCCLPVELSCFPCFSSTSIHCHSFTRLCFQCAVLLLQLHKPPLERQTFLKCLYCEESVNLQQLNPRTSFRIDFLVSARHHVLSEHSTYKCTMCPNVYPTMTALETHVWSDCGFSYRQLCSCGIYYCSSDNGHPCVWCAKCNQFIASEEKAIHDRENHLGFFCEACHQHVYSNKHDHQTTECMARKVTCDFCSSSFEALHLVDHLLSHLEESNERSRCLTDVLKKEQQLRQCILRKCCTSYSELYGQEDVEFGQFSNQFSSLHD